MTVTDAPESELGYPGGIAPTFTGGLGPGFTIEGLETNTDLRFPAASVIHDRMRREDGQVGSVLRAIVLPILGTTWTLDKKGVRPEVARFVESELGLNLEGAARRRRRRQGIVWQEHLREALLMLPFGFMPFETIYDVDVAAPGLEDPEQPGRLFAHLRKLAPRMPRTLTEVRVARDGGLAGIVQAPNGLPGQSVYGTFIPVDRLVMYVNDREGADWTGNSVLRTAYKHWLIKDALIRLGAQIVERNGMGIPVVNYRDPADRAKALALAKAFRAGAESGAALPDGMSLSVVGVAGSTADELPRVKYHDEAIGRSLLAMFLNLGHDNGARALGDTFVGIFRNAVGAVIRNVEETATEHVIRDLVELNYGPDEAYPTLKAGSLSEELTAEALKALADAKLLTPDDTLEAHTRHRFGLPAIDESTRPAPPPVAPPMGVPGTPGLTVVGADEPVTHTPTGAPTRPEFTAAAAGDDLVDRVAMLAERVIALRTGHPSP